MNRKPHISQRDSLSPCVTAVCGLRTEESLDMKLSLLDKDEKTTARPIRTKEGDTVYMEVTDCPYRRCPKALASMSTELPHPGRVVALCASQQVYDVYLKLTNTDKAKYEN